MKRRGIEVVPHSCVSHISKNKVYCSACKRDTASLTMFQDLNTQGYLCLLCLHHASGRLRLVPRLRHELMFEDWPLETDLVLLQAVADGYFGHWSEVATIVGKSVSACELHFANDWYCLRKCLPTIRSILEAKLRGVMNLDEVDEASIHQEIQRLKESVEVSVSLLKTKVTEFSKTEGRLRKSEQPDVLGYYSGRQDFEFEYDYELEQMVADLEFFEDDSESQQNLKLAVLDLYNKKLEERDKRKKFVLDRGLINLKKMVKEDKDMTPEVKDLHATMSPFARFMTEDSYKELIDLLATEREHLKKIAELRLYQQITCQALKEVEEKYQIPSDNHRERLLEEESGTGNNSSSSQRKDKVKMLIEVKNGIDREIQLFTSLGMKDMDYLFVRDIMVRESQIHKKVSKDHLLKCFDTKAIDKKKIIAIYNFLFAEGLIN